MWSSLLLDIVRARAAREAREAQARREDPVLKLLNQTMAALALAKRRRVVL